MFSEYEAQIAEHHRNLRTKKTRGLYRHLQTASQQQQHPSKLRRLFSRLRRVRVSVTFESPTPCEDEAVLEGLEPC